MKLIFSILTSIICCALVSGCQQKSESLNTEVVSPKFTIQDFFSATKAIEDKQLYEFQMNPDKHSWQEIDTYYKNLDKKHSGLALSLAQDRVTRLLLTSSGMLDKTDSYATTRSIFYTEKLAHSMMVDPKLMASVLSRMGDKLPSERKEEFARLMLNSSARMQASLQKKLQTSEPNARASAVEISNFKKKQSEKISKLAVDSHLLDKFVH